MKTINTRDAAEIVVDALVHRKTPLPESEVRAVLARMHQCFPGGSHGACIACYGFDYLDTLRFPAAKRDVA